MGIKHDTGQERGAGPSSGKVIYVIGPRALQNALLSSFLEEHTGVQCLTGTDFDSVQAEEGAEPDQFPLVLLDSHGKDLEGILVEIEAPDQNILARAYVALFNVDPKLKLEEEAVMRGVRGFFYEPDSPEPLLKGVKAIFDGEFWVSRAVMSQCIAKQKGRGITGAGAASQLTARETEILAMVAIGIKNEEIADKLCISPHTVKTHIYNIFKKIGVPNRLQAALWAARHL